MKKIFLVALLLIVFYGSANAATVVLFKNSAPPAALINSDAIILTFGDEVVAIHDAPQKTPGGTVIARNVPRRELFLARDRRPAAERLGYETLYDHHGTLLARVEEPELLAGIKDLRLQPVTASRAVFDKPDQTKGVPDPAVEAVLAQLNQDSFAEYDSQLSVDIHTRSTCAEPVLSARDGIQQEFEEMGLETSLQDFNSYCFGGPCNEATGYNVIGIKEGSVRPDEYYLVGAHYDSTSPNFCNVAPGANDNGSGTAGVLELARVFSQLDTEASLIFVAFAGEEQGLLGSDKFAKSLVDNGMDQQLQAFVIMDMITYKKNTFGILMEGSGATGYQFGVLNQIADLGRTYTDLDIETTTSYWGSDHEPLLDRGMAGVMMIEADWDAYTAYHTVNDTYDKQDFAFGLEVVKVAAAVLATGAVVIPEPPVDDDTADDDIFDDDTGDDDVADDDAVDDDATDDDAANDDAADDDAADDDATDDDSGDDDDDNDDGCGC